MVDQQREVRESGERVGIAGDELGPFTSDEEQRSIAIVFQLEQPLGIIEGLAVPTERHRGVFRGGVHGRSTTLAPAPRGSRYSDFRLDLALPCEQRGKPGEVWADDTDDDCSAAHDRSRPYQTICDRARIREMCWIVRNLLRLRVFTGNPSEQSDDLVFDRWGIDITSVKVASGKQAWSRPFRRSGRTVMTTFIGETTPRPATPPSPSTV